MDTGRQFCLKNSHQSLVLAVPQLDNCRRLEDVQVTYQSTSPAGPPASSSSIYEVAIAGQSLSLFTHSFLGFGQDAALHLSFESARAALNLAAGKVVHAASCLQFHSMPLTCPTPSIFIMSCVNLNFPSESLQLLAACTSKFRHPCGVQATVQQ